MDHCPEPPSDLSQEPLHSLALNWGWWWCWLLLAGEAPGEVSLVCLSLLLFSLSCPMLSNYPSPPSLPHHHHHARHWDRADSDHGFRERMGLMPDSSPGTALSKLQGILPLQLSSVSL